MKCPDCGSRMVKLKGNSKYECRNENCSVIEVRVQRRKGGLVVLRDSIMSSREMAKWQPRRMRLRELFTR